jgi:hypothetical protein
MKWNTSRIYVYIKYKTIEKLDPYFRKVEKVAEMYLQIF